MSLRLDDKYTIECIGASSSAGGRATILWFKTKKYPVTVTTKKNGLLSYLRDWWSK